MSEEFEDFNWKINEYDGKPYLYDENLGYMVSVTVTADGESKTMTLPVMDSNNKVLFDSLLLLLLHHCSLVLTETEEVIRLIVKQYMEIEKSTRLVLLQLLVKVSLLDKENPRVKKMLDYVLELNSRDIDVEVRVQARNIKAVMNNE